MAADRVHFCKQGFARSIVRYVLYHILNLRRRCKYENRRHRQRVCSSNRSHVGEELEGGVGVLAVFCEVESLKLGLGRDAQDAEAL